MESFHDQVWQAVYLGRFSSLFEAVAARLSAENRHGTPSRVRGRALPLTNAVYIEGDIARVDVSTKKLPNTFAVVDARIVGPIINDGQGRWIATKNPHSSTVYVMRAGGQRLHRAVVGAGDQDEVDHINGDGLDNRGCNLRLVGHRTNMRNQPRRMNNKTGVVGVSRRSNGKYRAYVNTDKGQLMLGTFDSLDAAVEARKKAEREAGYHSNHGREQHGHFNQMVTG